MIKSIVQAKSTSLIRWPLFLLNIEQPRLNYILKATLLGLVISLPLAVTLGTLFPNVERIDMYASPGYLSNVISAVAIAPVLETILMVVIFLLISVFTNHLLATCAISAGIWAMLHGVRYPIQGVVSFFGFFILSLAFKVWLKKSFSDTFAITASIHMLNNASVFVIGTALTWFAT